MITIYATGQDLTTLLNPCLAKERRPQNLSGVTKKLSLMLCKKKLSESFR